jgi:hypothetical protein
LTRVRDIYVWAYRNSLDLALALQNAGTHKGGVHAAHNPLA